MSQVLEEVKNAIKRLNLSHEIKLVEAEGEMIYKSLIQTFVAGGDRRWWWESFREPYESITFEDGKGFEKLDEFVPNKNEVVWFVVEDDGLPYYPIFESTTENAIKIIRECFAFEYYLVPKDKSWLLCENHHNRIMGIGKNVIRAIAQAACNKRL